MKRRQGFIICALAAVALGLGSLAACGENETEKEEEFSSEGLEYVLDSKTNSYSVVGYTGESANVYIPDTYEGKPVTSIASCNDIEGVNVFYDARITLERVKLGGNIKTIGDYAFASCTSLYDIEFGGSLFTIAPGAFYKCSALETLRLPESTESIGDSAFQGCYSLESVVLPDSVKIIGDNAFAECSCLESVNTGKGATKIGNRAFISCGKLKSALIGESVKEIGEGAFAYCSSLSVVSIPSSVNTIGAQAFYKCTSLKRAVFVEKDGWKEQNSGMAITSLGDSLTAAYYLTEEYWNCTWIREDSSSDSNLTS